VCIMYSQTYTYITHTHISIYYIKFKKLLAKINVCKFIPKHTHTHTHIPLYIEKTISHDKCVHMYSQTHTHTHTHLYITLY
jgi:hypothetical protein